MSKLVGVIGYPLSHSISPQFQQAAFDYYGLDVRYDVWETELDMLAERIGGLRAPDKLGANVTVPYKETVLPMMDEVDGLAARIGAVNTIVNSGGRLKGYNTDADGFLQALRKERGFEPAGKSVAILGAGGAARAIAFSLAQVGVKSLAIVNRDQSRAWRLADSLGVAAEVLPWDETVMEDEVSQAELIVNCTSLGMKHSSGEAQSPLAAKVIPKQALVFDIVYNPLETPLLREAREAGAETLGGLAMLVYQGAASFQLWTGREAPLEVMFQAARKALGA